MNLHLVLLICALVAFILATVNCPAKINLIALGGVFLVIMLLTGCQTTRTYSLGLHDESGRSAKFSVTLEPAKGLKK